MTWKTPIRMPALLLVLCGISLATERASAATQVTIRNEGPSAVQLSFDNGQPVTIASRESTRVNLNDGIHVTQCRFEAYDGCNLADDFTTTADVPRMTLTLRPVYTLEHAVALVGQGTLLAETRPDVWSTGTLDVAGPAADCLGYDSGKLGALSKRQAARISLRDMKLAMQNLCGSQLQVIGVTVNGAQAYFHPRFVMFKEKNGRPVLVRQ
jgi:hypothetical protein